MEIVVRQQDMWFSKAFDVQSDDFAEGMFLLRVAVVFSDADDAAPCLVYHLAAISEVALRCDCDGEYTEELLVYPVVFIVGEVHRSRQPR